MGLPKKSSAPGARDREERNTRITIGRRIAHQRAVLGYSQAELAEKFGVSRAALSQYEVGIGDINAGDMNYLAEILKQPVSYFFAMGGEGDAAENLSMVQTYFPFLPLDVQNVIVEVTISMYGVEVDRAGGEKRLHQKFRGSGVRES